MYRVLRTMHENLKTYRPMKRRSFNNLIGEMGECCKKHANLDVSFNCEDTGVCPYAWRCEVMYSAICDRMD